jgi:hypothetical protein
MIRKRKTKRRKRATIAAVMKRSTMHLMHTRYRESRLPLPPRQRLRNAKGKGPMTAITDG